MWLAGNQPYLMQVMCCHLFDDCIRSGVPVVTSRQVRDVVQKRVLSELSDFFQGQWKTLDPEHSASILRAVNEPSATFDPWRYRPDDPRVRFECSAELRKSLERAGLGSHRLGMLFVPLFVMWIREHFPSQSP
jgi:hypothetical protein